MDYENDLKIDPSILDVECVDQPDLVMKYARIVADADRAADEAKERLDLTKAELDNKIRTDPAAFGIEKVTETTVANCILTRKEYKASMAAYLQAKHEARIVSGASKAVDHRKSMLEALVKLHGQQYFAGPNIPHDLKVEWENKHTQVKANKAIKMKRRERDV